MAEKQVNMDVRTEKRRGGFFRKFFMLCGIGLMLLIIVGAYLYQQSRTPAKHVMEFRAYVENTTPEQRKQIADNLQMRITQELTRADHRGVTERGATSRGGAQVVSAEASYGQTRIVSMSLNEMQAWMDQNFTDWVANRGSSIPAGVSNVNVAVYQKNPVLFFNFNRDGFNQDVSVYFSVTLPEQGKGRIVVHRVGPGSLAVPSGIAATLAEKSGMSDNKEFFAEVRQAVDGMEFDNVIPIDALRDGRIISMSFRQDGCDMSVLIEPPKGKQARHQLENPGNGGQAAVPTR